MGISCNLSAYLRPESLLLDRSDLHSNQVLNPVSNQVLIPRATRSFILRVGNASNVITVRKRESKCKSITKDVNEKKNSTGQWDKGARG